VRDLIRWLLWGGAILGAIGLLLHLFFFDAWVVPRDAEIPFAASIFPTLAPEDKVLIHRGKTPGFGQLVRCASPLSPGAFVVGRVFGVAGDRVEVSDAAVMTNGKAMGTRHNCEPKTIAHPATGNLLTLSCSVSDISGSPFEYVYLAGAQTGAHMAQVEAGKLYLVSDNRTIRQDSRDFGQIEASTCEPIVYRLWGEKFSDASRRFTVLW
jgi:signal peptidase I